MGSHVDSGVTSLLHATGQLRSLAATCPQGISDKCDSDFVLRQGLGGFGRKEQMCGGGTQGLNEAGRPLRSGLLGLMEPVMIMGLGLHQFCGAGNCRG